MHPMPVLLAEKEGVQLSLVSMKKWFQDPLWIPKSEDAQVLL
jgi:hypothetical protein